MKNSICLILPYFGRFHAYFERWLRSVAYNKSITFLIFTNDRTPYDYPENVRVEYCEFDDFAQKLQKPFNFKISLRTPYKLCDFKPAYGIALQEFLKDYTFWGHCDCDLIFGDIRAFFSDILLNTHDKILSRGHLTLYRNTYSVNRFFMREAPGVTHWKKVLSSSGSFAYDEWAKGTGVSEMWSKLAPNKVYDEIIFDDINPMRKHFVSSQKFDQDRGRDCFIFHFHHGSLWRIYIDLQTESIVKELTCYAHFQKRDFKNEAVSMDDFFIIPNSFLDVQELKVDDLRIWGRQKIFYPKYFKIRYVNLLRKIKNAYKNGKIIKTRV